MTTMSPTSPPVSPQAHYGGNLRPQRDRAVSSMSQTSTSSRRSKNSNKLDLTESPKDKKRLNTKADPSKAITEAQPAAVALEDSNLEDLRLIQHKDMEGNIITDPDRSNPTRARMERPLDTIRAFNAAAEGTSRSRSSSYNRPMSQYGSQQGSEVGGNRRSYANNNGHTPSAQRPNRGYGNGYYRNSSYGFPDGSLNEVPGEGQYQAPPRPMRNPGHPIYNQNGHPNGNGNGGYYNNDSPMSAHSQQHSYETMTSGSDENGKSTNPSSLNSSYDHLHQARKPDHYALQNQYNEDIHFTPVPPQQLYSNYAATNGNTHQANGDVNVRDYDPYAGGSNGNSAPPRPPVKDYTPAPANNPRQPIRLNSTTTEGAPSMQPKRQSWIKRTFSRRGN